MSAEAIRLLLVGPGARQAIALLDHLRRHGCSVRIATTAREAARSLREQRFGLVLSEFLLPDGSGYDLISPLLGTNTTMFLASDLAISCWWMRAVARGRDCSSEPGMSPERFRVLLNEIIFDGMFEYAGVHATVKPERDASGRQDEPSRLVDSHAQS